MQIPFNKPFLTGKETEYIQQAVASQHISGNGMFTKRCHDFFEKKYDFPKVFLTTSCTDALEMSAILMNIQPGDEVIVPSFSFVSTANAFALRGAKIVFADSENTTPNIDADNLESLITGKTKAIVVVHYAGIACNMDKIVNIARKHDIYVVEDAAQAIDSFYKEKPLGTFGDFAAFSFHETKNIISGEGGMLVVNNNNFIKRAEIIWEKGTNRSAFFRGEVDKYSWVDIGSSFLPSDIIAAFLFSQLENIDTIQEKRKKLWNYYADKLGDSAQKGFFKIPYVPSDSTNNAHIFYLVCNSSDERRRLIDHLKSNGIGAVFHYLPLEKSPYYHAKHDGRELKNSNHFADCLVRLPMFFNLTFQEVDFVVNKILQHYSKKQ